MRHLLALEVGHLFVGAVFAYDQNQVIALVAIGVALYGKRHGTGQVHGEVGGAGREAAHVQATGAHGFDFGSVALNLVEHYLAVDTLGQVLGERREDVGVNGRIFDRCVGEHQRGGVTQLGGVSGRVGHQVAVGVAVHGVEVAAIRAIVLGLRA